MTETLAPRIHVVEDDKDIAHLINRFLTRGGYVVTESHTGEEGLKSILGLEPDLVILDVMLPGKSGLEVMDELRKDPRGKDIPILFLTALGGEATVVECLRGGDEYMEKPPRLLELETRVKRLLDRTAKDVPQSPPSVVQTDRLAVEYEKEVILVPLEEILFVEASGKYSYVYTEDRRYLAGYSIGELEKRPGFLEAFLRVHRSYLVNVGRVRKVIREKPRKVVVEFGSQVREFPVGDSYYPSVKSRFDI